MTNPVNILYRIYSWKIYPLWVDVHCTLYSVQEYVLYMYTILVDIKGFTIQGYSLQRNEGKKVNQKLYCTL